MDLNKILADWQDHCKIGHQLDETSKETPKLHAYYLDLLSRAKLKLRKAELEQKKLLKEKWLWYNGKMSDDEVISKGWNPDPFDGLKIMKGDMDYYYDSDPEIQASEEIITYWKTVIDTLKEILDVLKWRHQTIKNIITWRQFEAGE